MPRSVPGHIEQSRFSPRCFLLLVHGAVGAAPPRRGAVGCERRTLERRGTTRLPAGGPDRSPNATGRWHSTSTCCGSSSSTRRRKVRMAVQDSATIVALPLPDGGVARLQIVETAVMAPTAPPVPRTCRTWMGQGLDEQASTARLDWTPQGFHAMILSPANGQVFIDPYSSATTRRTTSATTRGITFRPAYFYPHGGLRSAANQVADGRISHRRLRGRNCTGCRRWPPHGVPRRSMAAPLRWVRPPS